MEHDERSELPDPAEGGAGLNEGESQGDQDRGGPARDEPSPEAGGAIGGRADPIAGSAGEDG
jgi:hypothetical protein